MRSWLISRDFCKVLVHWVVFARFDVKSWGSLKEQGKVELRVNGTVLTWFDGVIGELSEFRTICCEIWGFQFSWSKSRNGRRISRNLPKRGLFDYFGGIHGFLVYSCHDLKEILWVPNFYYMCQICYLRLGLRSSGFVHDWLQAPLILIVIRVVQSVLMNYWTIRIAKIFERNNWTVFPSLEIVLPDQRGIPCPYKVMQGESLTK